MVSSHLFHFSILCCPLGTLGARQICSPGSILSYRSLLSLSVRSLQGPVFRKRLSASAPQRPRECRRIMAISLGLGAKDARRLASLGVAWRHLATAIPRLPSSGHRLARTLEGSSSYKMRHIRMSGPRNHGNIWKPSKSRQESTNLQQLDLF